MDLLAIAAYLADALAGGGAIAASRSDGYIAAFMPLVLLLSGFIFFGMKYLKYRNTDKRHSHESETKAQIANLEQYDQLVEHRKRLNDPRMAGSNESAIEGSLLDGGGGMAQAFGKYLGDLSK